MRLKLVLRHIVVSVVCAYVPQAGREDSGKDDFYNTLEDPVVSLIDPKYTLPFDDFNGQVEQ